MNMRRILTVGALMVATIGMPVALAGQAFADQPADNACVTAYLKAHPGNGKPRVKGGGR
jgi:hypothetical protein